jgi:hypothetical protein
MGHNGDLWPGPLSTMWLRLWGLFIFVKLRAFRRLGDWFLKRSSSAFAGASSSPAFAGVYCRAIW